MFHPKKLRPNLGDLKVFSPQISNGLVVDISRLGRGIRRSCLTSNHHEVNKSFKNKATGIRCSKKKNILLLNAEEFG